MKYERVAREGLDVYKAMKSIYPNVTVKLDVLPQFNKQKSETLVYCEQTANNYLDVFRFSPIRMPKKKIKKRENGAAIPTCYTVKCQSVDIQARSPSHAITQI